MLRHWIGALTNGSRRPLPTAEQASCLSKSHCCDLAHRLIAHWGVPPKRAHGDGSCQGMRMYWMTAVTLLAAWVFGLCAFGLAHPAIHVLLVLAVVVFAWHVRVGGGNPI